MRFQISSVSGFAKLAKFKENSKIVETPTIMAISKKSDTLFWEIGDRKERFSLNLPPRYLSTEISMTEDYDFQFIVNLLMHKSLSEDVIEKQLNKTLETLHNSAESYSKEKSLVIIQPPKSERIFEKILHELNGLELQNIAITNLLPLINNSRRMTDFIAKLKTTLPLNSLLFLLSPIPHTYLPILAYTGIDVFSNGFANIATKQHLYLTDAGGAKLEEMNEITCSCNICSKHTEPEDLLSSFTESSTGELSLLKIHNERIFEKKMREIRSAVKKQDLRGYVEQAIQINPFSAGALRLLDKKWNDWLIARTPTWSTAPIKSITSYGFTRPSISEFQKRVQERFIIPSSKKVIIILPCSARKPYSQSKSHQKFIATISSIANNKKGYIQELILTSPLGVIPRELESVYPAAHYDIPVTGDWSYEEKQITINQLVGVLSEIDSDVAIIAHIAGEYIELCQEAEKILKRLFIYTSKKAQATTATSLEILSKEINKVVEPLPSIKFSADTYKIQKVADYQFGVGVGEAMFPEIYSLKGRPPLPFKILRQNQQYGVIHYSTGKLTLSMKNGGILAQKKKYFVMFDGEKLEGSTLFAVGVKKADPEIRPSDEVVIVDKKYSPLGVGHALMSGRDMETVRFGAVAKIKNKVK